MRNAPRGDRPRRDGARELAAGPRAIWPSERLRFAGTVSALIGATYLYFGYRFGAWPQPQPLEQGLAFAGDLLSDWYTSLPPPHWAFTHLLGIVPSGALHQVVFALWLAGLAAFWSGFVSICRTFGMPFLGALGAGLIVASTELAAVGTSQPKVFDFLYPNGLAFAAAVVAVAALLRRRLLLAGAVLGLATLIHPNVGLLVTAALVPAFLIMAGGAPRRLVRPGLAYAAVAGVALLRVAQDQTLGSELSAGVRSDLLAVVRAPHHYLYTAFPTVEYLQTALWLGALAAGLLVLPRLRTSLAVAATGVTIIAICGIGALASEAGTPLALIQAQTARLTPLLVLLGIAVAAAALTWLHAAWGSAALFAVFLLSPPVTDTLEPELQRLAPVYGEQVVAAALLIAALGSFVLIARLRRGAPLAPAGDDSAVPGHPARQPGTSRGRALLDLGGPALATCALAIVAAISLGVQHDERKRPIDHDKAFQEIAERARTASAPREVILTPPDLQKFRLLSHRPIVVDFWSFPFGVGDKEWVDRMGDVIQNRSVLEPSPIGTALSVRLGLIAKSYDRAVRRSRRAICRYRVKLVVARGRNEPPPWLREITHNRRFQLLRVLPDACGVSEVQALDKPS